MAQKGTPKSFLDEKIASYDFLDSSIPHDRILVVEENKFYVLSGTLSLTSEFFNTMFNGFFREKNETEIVLPDVEAVYFQNFLNVFYPAEFSVDEISLGGLMKLAARFLSPIVWQKCMKYLESEENFKKFDMLDLLEWSKEYNSIELKDRIETFLLSNFHFMEEEHQYYYMFSVVLKYNLEKLKSQITDQIKGWPQEKLFKYYIQCIEYSEDPTRTEHVKKLMDNFIKATLTGFDKFEQFFENYTAVALHWYEKLLVVFREDSEFSDLSELKILLRLAKKYSFSDLKNLIANNLSKQFLLTHSFKQLENAVKYNLESLKTSMENYLTLNAGSLPEDSRNILLKSSTEAKNFVLNALLKHKCENAEI